ncbi:hypothetical protein BpHYR1_043352 [Brachionus plicatilis]|uniref:Uncharacterized protein n=1 Tax=Brachionus plicatilis TaxID=10195 RepID=A0A3M7RN65_BRAPC|nr:hypothetical protein BpHYR1_043352 [Brachionus plicatilis]
MKFCRNHRFMNDYIIILKSQSENVFPIFFLIRSLWSIKPFKSQILVVSFVIVDFQSITGFEVQLSFAVECASEAEEVDA